MHEDYAGAFRENAPFRDVTMCGILGFSLAPGVTTYHQPGGGEGRPQQRGDPDVGDHFRIYPPRALRPRRRAAAGRVQRCRQGGCEPHTAGDAVHRAMVPAVHGSNSSDVAVERCKLFLGLGRKDHAVAHRRPFRADRGEEVAGRAITMLHSRIISRLAGRSRHHGHRAVRCLGVEHGG